MITRAEDLAGEKDCRPSKGTYRLDDVRIARTQRFTDVLVRREGRWQLVAGHASRVP